MQTTLAKVAVSYPPPQPVGWMNFFEGQFSSFEDTLNCELAGRHTPSSALLQDGVEQAVEQKPA
jgi:hypothetical protein